MIVLNKHERERVREAEKILSQHNIPYDLKDGGKHTHLIVAGRKFPLAGTPSDRLGIQNWRSDIKRFVRSLPLEKRQLSQC